MTEASVSFAGNLTDQPEVRYTDSGIARTMFRVAVSGRSEHSRRRCSRRALRAVLCSFCQILATRVTT